MIGHVTQDRETDIVLSEALRVLGHESQSDWPELRLGMRSYRCKDGLSLVCL